MLVASDGPRRRASFWRICVSGSEPTDAPRYVSLQGTALAPASNGKLASTPRWEVSRLHSKKKLLSQVSNYISKRAQSTDKFTQYGSRRLRSANWECKPLNIEAILHDKTDRHVGSPIHPAQNNWQIYGQRSCRLSLKNNECWLPWVPVTQRYARTQLKFKKIWKAQFQNYRLLTKDSSPDNE